MDYAAAVAALTARGRFGVSLGLARIEQLMAALDHPERRLRGALVGGTNGKGSVVAMVRSVLVAAGQRVGTMPKPHLVSYRERIAVDGEPLAPDDFAAAVEAVLPAVDRVATDLGPPTEFEVLTAAAVAELARRDVDLAIVEVGMGGRLDATNVLDLGVAAVTNVQHDHERYLGSTLEAIGREKAAIVKPSNLAVTGATGRGLRPIEERCESLGVELRRVGPRRRYRARTRESAWEGLVVDVVTPRRTLDRLRVGLLGSHQAGNAAVALGVLEALEDDAARNGRTLALDEDALRRGFAAVRWPGRLELVEHAELGRVLLDGAHNPAGASVLARALRELGVTGMPMVFGAMRGKRVTDVLRRLAQVRPRPFFTAVDDRNAHSPGLLLGAWRRVCAPGDDPGMTFVAVEEALRAAAAARRGDEPILVAGSLYLVGAVRGLLLGEREGARG